MLKNKSMPLFSILILIINIQCSGDIECSDDILKAYKTFLNDLKGKAPHEEKNVFKYSHENGELQVKYAGNEAISDVLKKGKKKRKKLRSFDFSMYTQVFEMGGDTVRICWKPKIKEQKIQLEQKNPRKENTVDEELKKYIETFATFYYGKIPIGFTKNTLQYPYFIKEGIEMRMSCGSELGTAKFDEANRKITIDANKKVFNGEAVDSETKSSIKNFNLTLKLNKKKIWNANNIENLNFDFFPACMYTLEISHPDYNTKELSFPLEVDQKFELEMKKVSKVVRYCIDSTYRGETYKQFEKTVTITKRIADYPIVIKTDNLPVEYKGLWKLKSKEVQINTDTKETKINLQRITRLCKVQLKIPKDLFTSYILTTPNFWEQKAFTGVVQYEYPVIPLKDDIVYLKIKKPKGYDLFCSEHKISGSWRDEYFVMRHTPKEGIVETGTIRRKKLPVKNIIIVGSNAEEIRKNKELYNSINEIVKNEKVKGNGYVLYICNGEQAIVDSVNLYNTILNMPSALYAPKLQDEYSRMKSQFKILNFNAKRQNVNFYWFLTSTAHFYVRRKGNFKKFMSKIPHKSDVNLSIITNFKISPSEQLTNIKKYKQIIF